MKILVTGAAGFIGSEFVRIYSNDAEITVIDNLSYAGDLKRLDLVKDKINFIKTDIVNRELLEYVFATNKPTHIVHFAAESHVDRSIMDSSPFIDANVKGTQTLLDVAKSHGVKKFINLSTDEVYGELGESGEFIETTPLAPNSPYSVSKASADMLGRAYYRTFGMPVVTVRPSNNYGPWQYPEKLIPVVILKAFNNEKIPVYGKGENVREWLYVSDCVRAIADLLERGKPGESYNIGSGFEKRNIDVVKAILDIMGKPQDLIEYVKDRPGHDFRYSLNSEKIKKGTNWNPTINFETGIQKTVQWNLSNIDWLKNKLTYLQSFWQKVYQK